jgi:hypothetical protein
MTTIYKFILIIFLLSYSMMAFAQKASNSFTFPAKGKQIIIDGKEASMDIEGYDGNDLVIEPYIPLASASVTEVNKGLTLISEIIPESNTINPTIIKQDASLISIQLPKGGCGHLKIKVPRNAHLKVDFSDTSPNGKICLKNLSGELELSGSIKLIEVSYISGPLTISAGGDGFNAGAGEKIIVSHLQFSESSAASNSPVPLLNIIGNLANVDISIPENLKATIQVDVPYGGELFSDLNLVPPKPKPGAYIPPIKNKFIGELNGGGKMITINAGYGNVFIRKQK